MEEKKINCTSCDAEINENVEFCPQCDKSINEEENPIDHASPEMLSNEDSEIGEATEIAESTVLKQGFFRSLTKAHILFAAAVLCIGLVGGYLLSLGVPSLFNSPDKQLSGPWTGAVTFTKVTSPDKTAQTQLAANLNQANNIDMHLYMDNDTAGMVYIPGLSLANVSTPVKIENGKLKFTIKSGANSVYFEAAKTTDKASGDQKLNGSVKMDTTMDNGKGGKIAAAYEGKLEMSMKKRK